MNGAHTSPLLSSSNVLRQGLREVEQQLHVLGLDDWKGTKLKQLDKGLRAHKDLALNAYLYWLHENPIKGDLSQPLFCQPIIQSWCDRLRSHSFDNRNIYGAFKHWKFVQARVDPATDNNYKVLDEKLSLYLKIPQYEFPGSSDTRKTRSNHRTMEKHLVIEVSSGEDSDVEFLGYGMQNNKQDDCDSSNNKMGGNKRFEKPLNTKEDEVRLEPEPALQLRSMSKEARTKRAANSRDVTWEYICKRCHKPGHHLLECPTNLDPSYDTKPANQYKCAICGAVGEHYGTLCPKNTAPWSLNQLRLKSGVSAIGGPHGNDDSHHVFSDAPTKMRAATGNRTREATVHTRHLDGHELANNESDVNYIHESRRALVDIVRSRQQSPQDGRKSGRRGEDRRSSPPYKRLRGKKEGSESEEESAADRENGYRFKERRDKRRCLDRGARFVSPEELQDGDGHRTRSSELLPVARHDRDVNGRLSYWDDEYSSPYHRDEVPIIEKSRSCLSKNSDIEWLFPGCDPLWQHEMTTFDVDKFLEGLDEHLASYEQEHLRQNIMARMVLGGAVFHGSPNNETAPFNGSCDEASQAIEAKGDSQATSREFYGSLGPKVEPDEHQAYSDRFEHIPPEVKAAVRAARVVPLYNRERTG